MAVSFVHLAQGVDKIEQHGRHGQQKTPPKEDNLYWKMITSEPLQGELKGKSGGNLKSMSMQVKDYKVSTPENLCVFFSREEK